MLIKRKIVIDKIELSRKYSGPRDINKSRCTGCKYFPRSLSNGISCKYIKLPSSKHRTLMRLCFGFDSDYMFYCKEHTAYTYIVC